jgi:hypothetical protein
VLLNNRYLIKLRLKSAILIFNIGNKGFKAFNSLIKLLVKGLLNFIILFKSSLKYLLNIINLS